MKYYAWTIDFYTRKGAYFRTDKGILKANNDEEALNILWNTKGSDFACNPTVEPLDMSTDFIEI